ncbi:MAG: clan AA aspartic protease [Candidatus Latescibacteria bacterium]|nr:clan AA aspartic protease [Candidatus Latescibacterota bacterium]
MIRGTVNEYGEAVIELIVRGPSGQEVQVEALIDTGFNGFLTLPPPLVMTLGLERLSRGRALLANGQETIFEIYSSTVLWEGNPREVETDVVGSTPLVGMALVHGSELYIHVVEGGLVQITAAADV